MTEREITEDEGAGEHDTLPTISVELFDDFEQARVISSVRQALFGRGRKLCIGRYVVERRLGAGGMGEVYLARDEELQRKVAIKRALPNLEHDRLGDDEREHEQERLRREGQALARLSHPNVVQVYEIGEHEGRRFVAMEYVDGQDLASWLEHPRSWRAVLDHFLAAGRGLAAAHAAGLVHRDFKPENVLIGTAGEVRVADFGLARVHERPPVEPTPLRARAAGPGAAALDSDELRLSATGAMLGTVRYMSLEQLRAARELDARSDQFSFCVALYEGLWNNPPFPASSVRVRLEALERGEPDAPPRSPVPARLWRAIRRGLAREPDARWPSMDALLDVLSGAPRRRRIIATSVGLTLTASLGVGGAMLVNGPPPSCAERSGRELAEAWSPALAETLSSRYADAGFEQGPPLGARVRAELDAWARTWTQARTRVCDSREASARPEAELRAQELCLTRTRRHAATLVELLTEVEVADGTLARGPDAVSQLGGPEACVEDDALLRVDPPPAQIAAEIDALRVVIERAHQLRLLGRYADAHALIFTVEARARALDYAPLHAELFAELAKLELLAGALDEGIELLHRAIDAAEVGHHEALATDLWIELALRTINALDDATVGAERLRRAEVAAARQGAPTPARAARLRYARSQLQLMSGAQGPGEASLREAIALAREHAPREYPTYLSRLAILRAPIDTEESLALHREALAAAERRFGAVHPVSADFYYELGSALVYGGDERAGRPLLERAVAMWTENAAQRGRKLAWSYELLAEFALADGELELAERHTLALVELQREILPPGHRETAAPELLFSVIASKRDQRAAALEHCEAALAIWTAVLPADDSRVISARVEAAGHLIALERLDDAVAEYQAIVRHGDPLAVLAARLGFAELELMRERPEGAAIQLQALDAALVAGELPGLGDHRYTHALMWGITDLRRGALGPERVEALAAAGEDLPFNDAQLRGWFDDLGLSERERERLGLEPPVP